MDAETVRKVMVILAKLRQDVPLTAAGVELRHAMDKTILALDAYREEAAGRP
jgi:hypothetical protein